MRAPARATTPQPWLRLSIALLAVGCTIARGSPGHQPAVTSAPAELSEARLAPIRAYIKSAWHSLERTHRDLSVAARDTKVPHREGEPWPVYIPANANLAGIEATLAAQMAPLDRHRIVLRPLAANAQPGLLYLPHPYVERPGGIMTSSLVSGSQWDAPFGWAPLQLLAIEGLRRYGYDEDAGRIRDKFLSLVVEVFEAQGTIVEKYDVVRRSSDVSAKLRFGYDSNEIGFGWTNGVFVELASRRGHRTSGRGSP